MLIAGGGVCSEVSSKCGRRKEKLSPSHAEGNGEEVLLGRIWGQVRPEDGGKAELGSPKGGGGGKGPSGTTQSPWLSAKQVTQPNLIFVALI